MRHVAEITDTSGNESVPAHDVKKNLPQKTCRMKKGLGHPTNLYAFFNRPIDTVASQVTFTARLADMMCWCVRMASWRFCGNTKEHCALRWPVPAFGDIWFERAGFQSKSHTCRRS